MHFKLNFRSLGRILVPLIFLTLALHALGARQLTGSGILKDPNEVKSVVLIDSGLVATIKKEELVGSQIIEIDGNSHYSKPDYDEYRQNRLKSLGYNMLRFEEGVVLNRFPEVHERLMYAIGVLKAGEGPPPP